MNVANVAAFSDGDAGGNPAGVVLCDTLPSAEEMQAVAAEVGYSETAFSAREGEVWRTRYFAPEMEVPFCGHATIALGAVLALNHGDGVYPLQLNETAISVEGRRDGDRLTAALQSPTTRSAPATADQVQAALALFGYTAADLDPRIPPAQVNGGAAHLLLALADRAALSAMKYDLAAGQVLMREHGWVTISLVHAETERLFHARNPFAAGGVYEDPATGAAAAAFSGYLRDLDWPHGGSIEIIQGEDMGAKSRLFAQITPEKGASIRVSGAARLMKPLGA
ncbi:PhzF family phenazine biosynthesis protein [Caulobacter segnis]|uniref:PhzF family phenazine biosynthesis protein n=1 Tax=Caulobacter segnis TaxID=88688 RepID=UPI00240EB26E|nr:PhzF family phenazine biosynthesis protein [Caulobacter segnis]MDG2522449.1 PhzF family phenazine biosynthesis protein [Caulobacter segnis]